MAIIKTGTFTTTLGGAAQNLTLGFTPSYFRAVNHTSIVTPTNTEIASFEWFSTMANASAYVRTYDASVIDLLTLLTTNGVTPFTTADNRLYVPAQAPYTTNNSTNLTITGISAAANASITATHSFTASDIGVTVVTFHEVVGMTQINTLSGIVQTVTGTTVFTVNINSTNFTAYSSGGIANVITGAPVTTVYGNTILPTAQANLGVIGLTFGTTLMAVTADTWRYEAHLNAPFTS